MARTFLTIARRHGETHAEVIFGPDVPHAEQVAALKANIGQGKAHREFAEIQLWASDEGIVRRHKFRAAPEPIREEPETKHPDPDPNEGRKKQQEEKKPSTPKK